MLPRRAQELIILVIGVFTPLGVLAVNGSAFIMRHLAEARLILAFCALISGLFLNGLAAFAGHRRARRHLPDLLEEYRWWIWAAIVLVVVASAVVGAYLTYLGMADATKLPDRTAVIASAFLLLFPFAITYAANHLEARRSQRPTRRTPEPKTR